MTYTPRLAPRAHQVEALRRVQGRPEAFAWLMEMGTGKTKVVLDEWGQGAMDGTGPRDLLVVAPAGSYRNWYEDREGRPSEATKHLDPALRDQMLVEYWQSGGGVLWKRRLEAFLREHSRPRMLVVNVEALSTVEAAETACLSFLGARRGMMVVDESTRIKNHSANRTRRTIRIGQWAGMRRILSGMVAPRDPLDLFSQFYFLDPRILGYNNFFAFRARYAVMRQMEVRGRQFQVVVGFRNIEELQRRIAPHSYRVLKKDCLDLEPKQYQRREVALTEEQKRLYREIKQFATAQLDAQSHVTATSVIVQIGKLHQLCMGHLVDEVGGIHDVPERRTAALIELLEEHSGKAVIWCPYVHTIDKVTAALRNWLRREAEEHDWEFDDGMVARYYGANERTRGDEEHRFLTDPACRYMVATPDAGGIGNNWVVADLSVYYGNKYDLELRSQSEDRLHRDGQVNRVTYVDLVAPGTVDEPIIKSLRNKLDLYTMITGENYREWLI